MKQVLIDMIHIYCINKLGYDFMGYEKNNNGLITYHHLIVPKRNNGPETIENGAVLYRTPHDYLHTIERYDLDVFEAITSEMIDMNIKGYLDMDNLVAINDILNNFEREYAGKRTKKGHEIVRHEYTRRLVKNGQHRIFY